MTLAEFHASDADLMDEHGYPTEEALSVIEHWPAGEDWPGLMEFARSCYNEHYGTSNRGGLHLFEIPRGILQASRATLVSES